MATDTELYGIAGSVLTGVLAKKLSKGAERGPNPAPQINLYNPLGNENKAVLSDDMRVKITCPSVTSAANGRITTTVIFPYTPSISFENKANYSAQNPTHSNFTQYFYQNSSAGAITITGKFSVENDADGIELMSVIHTLKTLTKMKTGTDTDAGSPPPVCRLNAYGSYMFNNVPIVIGSFKHELPESVDYYTISKTNSTSGKNTLGDFTGNSLPTISTITLMCYPVYSRSEMQKFNVTNWTAGNFNGRNSVVGYL
jgi:hypothetical protein